MEEKYVNFNNSKLFKLFYPNFFMNNKDKFLNQALSITPEDIQPYSFDRNMTCPFSFKMLVAIALNHSATKCLHLQDIYDYIKKMFPRFNQSQIENNVRQTLFKSKNLFLKNPNNLWSIDLRMN